MVEQRKCARHVLANWWKSWKGIERKVFWGISKSTFEAELKNNIQEMKKLGRACLDDLLWYNLDTWRKKYFQDNNKCDVMDNNMAESFNAWILLLRYKTIITMLEEIMVKMIKRIGNLRLFSNTWITIYLLCLWRFCKKILTSLCNETCLGMEKKVLRLSTMILHILWTLLVGVVVIDLGSLGAFLVLMVLLSFITMSWNQSIMWLVVITGRPASSHMPILFS